MKKIISIFCSLGVSALAAQNEDPDTQVSCAHFQNVTPISRGQFGDFYYEKVVTGTSYFWSGCRRVSDNLNGGQNGGTITSSNTVTFSRTVTGAIDGLTFSGAISVSSSIGYSVNVGAHTTAYLAYKCYYMKETGIRQKYSQMTGQVVGTNTYTINIPQYGQYCLIDANTGLEIS